VDYYDRSGTIHHLSADVVILAANAIGTARLLLLSASNDFPDGLANSSGLVGRRLMTHPFASVVGLFDEEDASWEGPFGQSIQSMQFYETDSSRDFVRGAKWGLLPTGGPIAHAMGSLMDDGPQQSGPHAAVQDRVGHSIQWGLIAEDLPDEANRVELHDSLTDSDGIPSVRLIAKDDDNVRRNLAFQVDRAIESLQTAGAYRTIAVTGKKTRSHNIGTTVMGNDPKRSVVDEFGRAHDVPNLVIVGASTFPTSAGVNPTATLTAVTLRSIENLMASHQTQRVPV
jgi:choline dehydrogenase-like flavoprotein